MERIYKAVLVHAHNNPKTDKIELAVYLNNTRDFDITVGGLAINTIIRQTYNYYVKKKISKMLISF